METITNQILEDCVEICSPRWMQITANFNSRGGTLINGTGMYKGIEKKIIFKSQDLPEEPTLNRNIEIRKTVEYERMVYGIVYAPDEVDTDGHTASAEEIKKASENFMKAGRTTSIDKQHNYATDEGFVSENWITKEEMFCFPMTR